MFLQLFVLVDVMSWSTGEITCPTSVMTFNTGLSPLIPNYTRRRHTIPGALRETQADVLCLQEVWFERDMKLLHDQLHDIYPYSWSPLHHSMSSLTPYTSSCPTLLQPIKSFAPAPCTNHKYLSLGWCVVKKCDTCTCRTKKCLITCIVDNCSETLFSLPQACITCLSESGGNARTKLARCFGLNRRNRINNEGLVILSKKKIETANLHSYFPGVKLLYKRGYIKARIDDVGLVVCTQLSGNIGSENRYLEVNLKQIETISSSIDQQRSEITKLVGTFSEPHIIMGDLNCGPGIKSLGIEGRFQENYQRFMAGAYLNHYARKDDANCTCCLTNQVQDTCSTANVLLDHVLVKGLTPISSQRVLTEDSKGRALSHRYGIRVELCSQGLPMDAVENLPFNQ